MPNWLQMPDGRLLNFQDAKNVIQNGSNLVITRADNSQEIVNYTDASAASTGLIALLASLQQSTGGTSAPLISADYVVPAVVVHGSPQVAVLVGSGFALDIVTAVFYGTVTIGVDTIVDPNLVYVNNNTLLLQWTPTAAGTFDVVYKRSGSSITYTITNGITIT